jgi:hypothetical protein
VGDRLAADEGSIVVLACIIILAFSLLAGVVMQIGDWSEHRRSIQVRADAAALAGAQLFGECFDSSAFTQAQVATNMHEMARHYAGYSSSVAGAALNPQFGGGSVTDPVFASKTYPDGGGGGADDTDTRNECQSMQLDVKLQDSNIPSLMKIFPGATVHGHARVEAKQIRSFKGSFPLAIPEVEPKYVTATFVDESTGNELTGCGATGLVTGTTCTYTLTKGASANSLTAYTASVTPNFPSTGVTASLGKAIGVRIGMGGARGTCANTAGNDNWACFDGGTTSRGALALRDYASGSGGAVQPNAPILRAVYPSNSCSPSFATGFGTTSYVSDAGGAATCAVGVSARIDFGTTNVDPTKTKATGGVQAVVTATINGSTLTLLPVAGSYDATTTTWLWAVSSGSATVPVDDSGTTSGYPVTISWAEQDGTQGGNTCNTGGGNKCKGTFDGGAAVMRFTSATSDDEGPIKLMAVTQGGTNMQSFTPGLTTVGLEIRIEGSLGVVNPPVLQALRLTHTGSRTTAVNCDGTGASDFTNSIITGCKTPYQINTNQICPDPAAPTPADCVPTKTGNLGTTVTKALDDRLAGCPADHWAQYGSSYPGDPRLIVMMLTDFSAFNAQGKTTVPVVNFAGFYIVGWTGNKCGAAWPFPGKEPSGGNIWGYFVKYVALNQVPDGPICDPNQITPCVPVLVR